VDGAAVARQIAVGHDVLLQRRFDVVEQDIGDEAVDAGVDATRRRPMHITFGGNEMRQHRQIGEAARVSGLGRVAANTLEVIALEIELARFHKACFVEAWMLAHLALPRPLFSMTAQKAFPSAGMDIVEAGRCLALRRNNAAIYHLMQVAEVGLRTLAWDRRVAVLRHKGKTIVPLDYAQWGEILGELEKKKALINTWKRGKALREEAIQYYSSVIFEVASFNEIYRKHISHARGKLYEDDTAVSCWGHVYRFMDKLAERMSEEKRNKLVWSASKPITPLEEFLK